MGILRLVEDLVKRSQERAVGCSGLGVGVEGGREEEFERRWSGGRAVCQMAEFVGTGGSADLERARERGLWHGRWRGPSRCVVSRNGAG